MKTADVVVIGAGVVGSSCALIMAEAGLKVIVVDRGPIAGGTTGAGEGNIMVSDKEIVPEIELAVRSRNAWFEIADRIGNNFELQAKGGIALSRTDAGMAGLRALASHQNAHGIETIEVDGARLRELEPHMNPEIETAIHYPGDGQCQPMLSAAYFLRTVRHLKGEVWQRTEVLGFSKDKDGSIIGVRTSKEEISTRYVVNATGTWAGDIARLAGSELSIMPRRGFILVTTPAPKLIHHKVYDADYVANVASDSPELQSSAVVEGTESGTILIGASRERIGFDSRINMAALERLAKQAISVFPVLSKLELLRVYRGFRPYSPDHLPVIGEDANVKGLFHCAGHEGAGIGTAPGSGELLTAMILGKPTFMDATPFLPKRFQGVA